MARKKLNKKVALIGSGVFGLTVVLVIVFLLYLNRDPDKFIGYADAAVLAAREASDEEIKAEYYKKAESDYREAYGLLKADSERIKILFKLASMYQDTDDWPKVVGCWNEIIKLDPRNAEARFSVLKYSYLAADSGMVGFWSEVGSQASELMEVAEQEDLLAEDTAKWDPFAGLGEAESGQKLGPYLYFLRGRANLQTARMGAAPDREQLLAKATSDLGKVLELEPAHVDASWYLAQAAVTEGEILAQKGDFKQREESVERALQILKETVEAAGDNPKAHINLLRMKLVQSRSEGLDKLEENIESLEPDCLSLAEKFPSSGEVYSALAGFYGLRAATLDKAVGAAEKAVELDNDNVSYLRIAANRHYSRFCVEDVREDLDKAIALANHALTLPDAQESKGPRQWARRMNRIALSSFLAECYLEQIFELSGRLTEAEKQELLVKAEQCVHEIEQILRTGEAPEVLKWRGLLELARGNRSSAIRKMYVAYEQLKSVDRKDSLLSYRLAKVFETTSELGAVKEFLESALVSTSQIAGIDEKKPHAILEYADVLLRLGNYTDALRVVDFFCKKYEANERSERLEMKAYIGTGQYATVEEKLSVMGRDDARAIELRLALSESKVRRYQMALTKKQAEEASPAIFMESENGEEGASDIRGSVDELTTERDRYRAQSGELVEKLLGVEPDLVTSDSVVSACNYYVSVGKLNEARALINKYLEAVSEGPADTPVRFYLQLLDEPDPGRVPQERRKQVEEQVLSSISDPVVRAVSLGRFYHKHGERAKASVEFHKVFDGDLSEAAQKGGTAGTDGETDYRRLAAGYLFEVALSDEDWDKSSAIAEAGRKEDLDGCEGHFFAARMAVAKGQNEAALQLVDKCLELRPVFSQGFLIRSSINAALGNYSSAIEDARRASLWNPLDGNVARGLAVVLYERNRRLGVNVTAEQRIEAKRSLLNAVRLNPRDLKLRGFYADYISEDAPQEALAIRQRLQRALPSVENALLLGRMAMRLGLDEADTERQKAYFDIAESSFEAALSLGPQEEATVASAAEFYRATGQEEKAQALVAESGDKRLLWVHYIRLGKFEDAKQVLNEEYAQDATSAEVLRGLLYVAERTSDQEGVKKYSEDLVSIDDSADNRLLQMQTFLKAGLIKEAERKMESFKEKFSEDRRALLLEAWLAMRQGQLERAFDLANQSLGSDRSNAAAWRLRGRLNLLKGDYNEAISDLGESKSLADDLDTRYYLARAYLRAHRADDAVTELKSAINLPQFSAEETEMSQPRRLLEQVYLKSGRMRALKELYSQTLEKFPESVFWYNKAAAFAMAGQAYGEAEKLYGRALQIAESKKQRGAKGWDNDQMSKALSGHLKVLILSAGTPGSGASGWRPAKLDKVFEVGSKYCDGYFAPIAYLRMGEAKMKLGEKGAVVQHCRTALAKAFSQPGHPFASEVLSGMYSLLGAEQVLSICRQNLEAQPESVAANLAMVNLMRRAGEYNKAIDYIDKCIAIVGSQDERSSDFVVDKAFVLTLAYQRTSDKDYLERAIKQYESLLGKLPNNTTVLNNLAYMLASNNQKLPEALAYAKRAHEATPNSAGIMDTYAFVLYKNGKYAEADSFLQAALQQYEQSSISVPGELYEHVGMVKEALKLRQEAIEAYEQALKEGESELSDAARERIRAAVRRLSAEGA